MNTEPNSLPADVPAADTSATPQLERWQQIQAEFVDDPQRSLVDARQLVDDLMRQVVDGLVEKRSELDRQWSVESEASTEQLRVCLQNYRAFFAGLLPVMPVASPSNLEGEGGFE